MMKYSALFRLHLLCIALLVTCVSPSQLPHLAASSSILRERSNQNVTLALATATDGRTDVQTAVNSWRKMHDRVSQFAREWSKQVKVTLLQPQFTVNLSSSCLSSIEQLLLSYQQLQPWAVAMIDSWGKFPMSGILEGTLTDFGDFDECLSIVPSTSLPPQYCTIEARPLMPPRPRFHNLVHPLHHFYNLTSIASASPIGPLFLQNVHYFYYITFRLGVCLPSECSRDELNLFISSVTSEKLAIQARVTKCESRPEYFSLNGNQIVAFIVLATLILLTAIGTAVDYLQVDSIMRSFSIPRNLEQVLHGKSSESTLSCLHGIRVLTMGWVVMGHTYALTNHQAFSHGFGVAELVTQFSAQWFINATLSVDTFFFISGLLTTFATWKMTSGGQYRLFSTPAFILARILRTSPPMLVTISLTFLLPLFGSGPVFRETIDPVVNDCKKNWWTNVLFIQNWVDARHICLLHTWYLANDFHFHLMSLAVIVPLLMGKKQIAFTTCTVIAVGSIIIAGVINFINDYPPGMLYAQPEIEERWDLNFDYYWRPYSHCGAYFVGIIFGYALATGKRRLLDRRSLLVGWTASLMTLFVTLFGVYGWNGGHESGRLVNALYASTHRTFWALGLSWLVYACSTGQGGLIGSFLSWRGFSPFSRLTFSVYLVHPWLIWLYMGQVRHIVPANHYTGFYVFLAHWVLSYFAALVLTLLVEAPLVQLSKLLVARLAGGPHQGPVASVSVRGARTAASNLHQTSKVQVPLLPNSLTNAATATDLYHLNGGELKGTSNNNESVKSSV